jgi:hypothetical protein
LFHTFKKEITQKRNFYFFLIFQGVAREKWLVRLYFSFVCCSLRISDWQTIVFLFGSVKWEEEVRERKRKKEIHENRKRQLSLLARVSVVGYIRNILYMADIGERERESPYILDGSVCILSAAASRRKCRTVVRIPPPPPTPSISIGAEPSRVLLLLLSTLYTGI